MRVAVALSTKIIGQVSSAYTLITVVDCEKVFLGFYKDLSRLTPKKKSNQIILSTSFVMVFHISSSEGGGYPRGSLSWILVFNKICLRWISHHCLTFMIGIKSRSLTQVQFLKYFKSNSLWWSGTFITNMVFVHTKPTEKGNLFQMSFCHGLQEN